ncbi:hypothetical protein WJR50_17865 [Catalinimonas sp. 4WD22]|uniref:hypothetical protein n=1 Tax=Catalinimonas locisalis TaxID=3133978 RepID=UPI0031013A86
MKRLIYALALVINGLPLLAQNSISSEKPEDLIFSGSIQLLSFTSVVQENTVQLAWNTALEKDVDSFRIERATSNMEFKVIGKVEGKSDADKKVNYKFVDKNPLQGLAYYCLSTTDLDGNVEFHNIISASIERLEENSYETYPRVISDNYLKLAASQVPISEIRLLDFSGMVVFSFFPEGGDTNCLRLPEQVKPGAYLLVMFSDQGNQHQQKVMIL